MRPPLMHGTPIAGVGITIVIESLRPAPYSNIALCAMFNAQCVQTENEMITYTVLCEVHILQFELCKV